MIMPTSEVETNFAATNALDSDFPDTCRRWPCTLQGVVV